MTLLATVCLLHRSCEKVLAKGKAVPRAALGTTGRAALVTGESSGGGSWEEQSSRAELPSTWGEGQVGRLSHRLVVSADLTLALEGGDLLVRCAIGSEPLCSPFFVSRGLSLGGCPAQTS